MYKIIAILALLGALGAAHIWDKGVAVDNAIELTTGRLNKEWQDKLDDSRRKKEKAQEELSISHFKEVEAKNAKIKDISGQLNSALISLQSRPYRPQPSTDSSGSATTPQTCTGRELPREDAEFLTRESAAAQEIVVERDYYYQEYENLRLILEQLRK